MQFVKTFHRFIFNHVYLTWGGYRTYIGWNFNSIIFIYVYTKYWIFKILKIIFLW